MIIFYILTTLSLGNVWTSLAENCFWSLLGLKGLIQFLVLRNVGVVHTAISRKVVGRNVHATIPKGNMAYDQYAVLDTVAVESSIVAFL